MKKEEYVAPVTSCRCIEVWSHLLENSVDTEVPDIPIVDEVKGEKFDFNDSPFSDSPWDN